MKKDDLISLDPNLIQSFSNAKALGMYCFLKSCDYSPTFHELRIHFDQSFHHMNEMIDYLLLKKFIKIIPSPTLKKSDCIIELI